MSKILTVNNLDFAYGDNHIFENITFYLESNTINYIIGSNNCGKTTLIKLISGVLPSFNCIKIDNVILNKNNINKYLRAMGVALFESSNQFLFDNVLKEMSFPLENLNLSKKKILARVDEVLDLFNMKSIKTKQISDLSLLEKNKLIIALSMLHKPRVLLLDNPYIGLNKKQSNVINRLLKLICKKENITILLTTDNLENILIGDNVLVLGDKKIFLQGSVLEILKQDNKLVRSGINIPTMIDLSIKLSEYNLLDEIILDTDRMVDTLWK